MVLFTKLKISPGSHVLSLHPQRAVLYPPTTNSADGVRSYSASFRVCRSGRRQRLFCAAQAIGKCHVPCFFYQTAADDILIKSNRRVPQLGISGQLRLKFFPRHTCDDDFTISDDITEFLRGYHSPCIFAHARQSGRHHL